MDTAAVRTTARAGRPSGRHAGGLAPPENGCPLNFAQGRQKRDRRSVCIVPEELPIISFVSRGELRRWLDLNHSTSTGIWVRLAKKGSGVPSATFHDVLEEGLCFGWSESNRKAADAVSYLQRFTPRRVRGTTSERNHRLAARLTAEGLMTESGLRALGHVSGRGVTDDG